MSWQDYLNSVHMKDLHSISPVILEALTTIKPTQLTGMSALSVAQSQKPRPKRTATMDDRIYVVAGTRAEYDEYYHRTFDWNLHGRTTFYWVRDANGIRGIRDPHGVFIGSWRNLPEIKDIVYYMYTQSSGNANLRKVLEEL